jgi:hypothetical protein
MMSAESGFSPKLIGNSMAMVATGPMPGRTPMRVPRSAPIKQKRRFAGVVTAEKPNPRESKISITLATQRWVVPAI